jgi:uncharacterized protein
MKTHLLPILSVCALATLCYTTLEARAEAQPNGISVTGECMKKVTRDRGAVTVTSSIVAPSAREASQKAIQAHEKIKGSVSALKLAGLVPATAGYTVSQECSYGNAGKQCTGYRAALSTRYETPNLHDLESIVEVASAQGAEDVSQLETFVAPETLKKERDGCLEIATQNARAKAEQIARGAGVKIGKPLLLQEGSGAERPEPRIARAYAAAPMAAGGAAAPSIDAAPLDLQVSVTAVYGIE